MEQVEQGGDGDGNTEIVPVESSKRPSQHKYWCFTLNNWEEEQVEHLEQVLRHECQWYVFQEEEGESGTPHLQGTLALKTRQRLTELKRLEKGIHWEPTRSIRASVAYATKDATRAGRIHSYGIEVPKPVHVSEPRGWQLQVMRILADEPHARQIHWFWEATGNVGKSTLSKYLVVRRGAILVSGKSSDVAHALSKRGGNVSIVIIDVPRVSQDYVNYASMEAIKNGLLFSGKYDSAQVVFNTPHVIVFANCEPDKSKLSADRWDVHEIDASLP